MVARPSRQGLLRLHSTSTTSTDNILSPVLLRRAQSIAQEHTRLSAENAENYDLAVAKKIGEMGAVTAAVKEWDEAHNVR
jgi:peptide chain release factor 1